MIVRPTEMTARFEKWRKGDYKRRTLSTGFDDLDNHLKLAKGFLLVISGFPSCGKSEWLDAVLVNMTLMHNWNVLYYSPENFPIEQHMAKLAEKYIGKNIATFDKDDSSKAIQYLEDHYRWIDTEDPKLDNLMLLAEKHANDNPLDCFVIDPWNSVTHQRSNAMLHEYLTEALSKIIRFARSKNIMVAIVAHPTKPQKDRDGNIPVPTLYDISDGAAWRNRCDLGVICHRSDMSKNEIQIYVQKIKQKQFGKPGVVTMDYNYNNGRFKCQQEVEFLTPIEIPAPF